MGWGNRGHQNKSGKLRVFLVFCMVLGVLGLVFGIVFRFLQMVENRAEHGEKEKKREKVGEKRKKTTKLGSVQFSDKIGSLLPTLRVHFGLRDGAVKR